jgi:hypothetical protein
MEAHSLQTVISEPRAKDGGLAAGFAVILREVGRLLADSGGLVVVVIGVVAVTTITTSVVASVPEEAVTVATAAFTVLGTIVGAYFGVRVGSRGKDQADEARTKADAKVETLLAHVEPAEAQKALDAVNEAAPC